MIKNRILLIYPFILMGLLLMLQNSCKKDDDKPIIPKVNTTPIIFNPNLSYGTVTDIDGNTYKTIQIDTQIWMAENLKTTKYRNGDPIPHVTVEADWMALLTGAYCNYNNNVNHVETYGRLYNWFAVSDNRNIAPIGWHIPSDAEWTALITYLGSDAGSKLKEVGNTHWKNGNSTSNNQSGFTALPGGMRSGGSICSVFDSIWHYGFWWSSTVSNNDKSWYRYVGYDTTSTFRFDYYHNTGYSVRCIKD